MMKMGMIHAFRVGITPLESAFCLDGHQSGLNVIEIMGDKTADRPVNVPIRTLFLFPLDQQRIEISFQSRQDALLGLPPSYQFEAMPVLSFWIMIRINVRIQSAKSSK